MSHVDSNIFSTVIFDVNAEYENIVKKMIIHGKIQKYLVMNIDYSFPVKVNLSMVDYILKVIGEIPEDMKGESSTPASLHLFNIVEDTTKLSQTDKDLFCHFVAHLFYLPNWARSYIQLEVSFYAIYL